MKLTYRIDQLPARQRAAYLACGTRQGNTVTIYTAAPCFAQIVSGNGLGKSADSPKSPNSIPCPRCGGAHEVGHCPIPPDTTPEKERAKAKQGGCCGEPSSD